MAGRYNPRKRNLDDFDPNKSDSDDLDYGAEASSPRARPQARSSRKSKAGASSRKPAKRARKETYGDSEDDIELDSDAASSDEGSFAESEEEQDVELNPRTGRGVRSAARKPVKYEEPSEDEIEAVDTDDSTPARGSKRKGTVNAVEEEKLIVKLPIPRAKLAKMEGGRSTRSRTGSKGIAKREPTPGTSSAMGTRRSSRISHDEERPLVALSDSGKHETITRAGTETPEPPPSRRPTRGGKSVKMPSAIMEESQEDAPSQPGEQFFSQLQAEADKQEAEAAVESPAAEDDTQADPPGDDVVMEQVVAESQEEDEEDEAPVARGAGRGLRSSRRKASTPPATQESAPGNRRSLRPRKSAGEPSSDFEPDAEGEAEADEDVSGSDDNLLKPPGAGSSSESQGGRRSGRVGRSTRQASQRSRSRRHQSEDEELDPEEIADEAADLEEDNRRNRRTRKRPATRNEIAFEPNLRTRGARPDYRVFRPELLQQADDDAPAIPATTPQRNRRAGGTVGYRSLFSTYGPFGGAGGPPPVFGGPDGQGTTGGVDSDSSDDEGAGRGGQGIGGTVGMTPTSAAFPKPYVPQTHNADPIQGPGGGPPGLGKVKDKKALADADPLGVDPNVSFEGVGGLNDHIDRLKEMVTLPLLYPEVFQRFHVTPPRGVLFHGPPGTGKTLLARALASSVSSHGKKVTFYMRKGADALSKWVGEAEKQLRLLFEEARKNQPSIIFFDEIDGLAPVRSSKQEQIHASIVATLLALMDGMDGRGQVIVIGATNRPDSVDPALRRPGRFDREFYFPLPSQPARRAIIDIHTKGWDPPLQEEFKEQLADITKGYGGADLRALCTEAALNAVQGTFPQIYMSDKKLIIDPSTIKVMAKDFMISANKIVPSSERSAASGAVPLKKDVEPLLRRPLEQIQKEIDKSIPRKRKATALEEAMYDDRDDELGFERENMQRHFESARIFRPRLLIKGLQGMGQQYLGGALLSKLEGLHVQNMGLSTLMSDSTRSPEAAIIQLFEEVKRHKPSIIYIPDVETWYHTLTDSAIRTFTGLLRSIPPTEPVLLLGYMELAREGAKPDHNMLRDLFGYSMKNQFDLGNPGAPERQEFFDQIIKMVRRSPAEFPEQENRKRRKLVELPVAPTPIVNTEPSKAEQKAQKKKDRITLNILKIQIQNVMDQIKLKYRKFRLPIVDDAQIGYLYDEQDPNVLSTDLDEAARQEQALFRPYEIDQDDKGVQGLREVATGKFYYNLQIVTIEQRLSNGYYKRPKDFLADIKRLAKDAHTSGDPDRTLKANEMVANVDVDMSGIETNMPALAAECEAVYEREQARERERVRKLREAESRGEDVPKIIPNVPPQHASKTTTETSGPVVLGQEVPGPRQLFPVTPNRLHGPSPASQQWSTTNGTSHQTNGSTVPSRPEGQEDSEMYDDSPADYKPPPHPEQGGHSQNTQGQPRSQRSAHTQLAHGSQLDQYQNSASTTTSGQKTSDRSNRSSGPYSVYTQQSNGVKASDHPDFSTIAPASGGSQLPDTQEVIHQSSQSQPNSQASQSMAPPAVNHRASGMGIQNLLNEPSATAAAPKIILDEQALDKLHTELVKRSSGFSVEQLEQVNAALMVAIYETRGEWNRIKVTHRVMDAFNETVEDIVQCQLVLKASQEEEEGLDYTQVP